MKKEDDNLNFEIYFYENFLKERPHYIYALIALGDAYTKRWLYEKGLKIDKRLTQIRPVDPVVFYNLACSYSLLGLIDDSAAALRRAIKLGYRDLNCLKQDPDLENLKKSPEYNLIIKGLLKKKRIKEGL